MSIYDRVFAYGDRLPDETALIFEGGFFTYRQLQEYIKVAANILQQRYLKPKEKALILLPNCPEFIIAFFSVVLAGGVVVLADTKLNEELGQILLDNEIRLLFTDYAGREKLKKVSAKLPANSFIEPFIIDRQNFFSTCLANVSGEGALSFEGNLDDEALILYTSGSTGKPKGVINSHRTLRDALDNYSQTLSFTREDKLVAVTPFFHSYALGSCVFTGLAAGATLLLSEEFHPRQILKLMTREKATVFHGVPYMYELFNQHYNPQEYCLENMSYFISAGTALPEKVAREFYLRTKKVIHQEYGSSETGTLALNLSDDVDLNIKSVGRPLKNVTIDIRPENNEETGIIYVKKTGCGVGYVGEKPFPKGWYSTGDIGMMLSGGYLRITGRQKKTINIAGLKVNPEEVECCLKEHPMVNDVKVVGEDHPDFGQVIKAYVIRNNVSLTKLSLLSYCRQCLALYKVPSSIEWVEFLPKSGLGKNQTL